MLAVVNMDHHILIRLRFMILTPKQWIANAGNFPENKFVADAVVLNDKVYVVSGSTASGVYSNKVFAADLNASVEGLYDLIPQGWRCPCWHTCRTVRICRWIGDGNQDGGWGGDCE